MNHTPARYLVVTLLAISCLAHKADAALQSQARFAGHWEGAFARFGAVQTVAMDIVSTSSGLTGTYEIPDLILYREPFRELNSVDDTLHLSLFWGEFVCALHTQNDEITGQSLKWGPPVAIHLRRAIKADQFHIEPVKFRGDSVTLAGDLLIPASNPPFPAVVLIEGSTTEGRALWTYRSLADLFAQNGIAALVYDKRGVGASEGNAATVTFDQLANDAADAAKFLQDRQDIRPRSVGLLGISQGGWLAPLAASRCRDIAFLILYSGPAVSTWEQELERVEYSMRAGSLNEDKPDSFSVQEIKAALAHTQLGFDVAQHPERWSDWQTSVQQARRSRWSGYVALDSSIDELQGWLRQRYDPAETLKHTRTPTLALFGQDDVLVPPSLNEPALRSLLAEAGNSDVTIVLLPGVGHSLIRNATLVGGTWDWPGGFWQWARRAPGVADSLVIWTRRHAGP